MGGVVEPSAQNPVTAVPPGDMTTIPLSSSGTSTFTGSVSSSRVFQLLKIDASGVKRISCHVETPTVLETVISAQYPTL